MNIKGMDKMVESNGENMGTEKNKKIIQSMPNFDAKIFKDITGIDI